jgi:hypothetical protein
MRGGLDGATPDSVLVEKSGNIFDIIFRAIQQFSSRSSVWIC